MLWFSRFSWFWNLPKCCWHVMRQRRQKQPFHTPSFNRLHWCWRRVQRKAQRHLAVSPVETFVQPFWKPMQIKVANGIGFLEGPCSNDSDGQTQSFDLYPREWDMRIQFSRRNHITCLCSRLYLNSRWVGVCGSSHLSIHAQRTAQHRQCYISSIQSAAWKICRAATNSCIGCAKRKTSCSYQCIGRARA